MVNLKSSPYQINKARSSLLSLLPNALSLSRIPLAFFFFSQDPLVRLLSLFLAMASDLLDGFLARRWGVSSSFGLWIDPICDKVYMGIISSILFLEKQFSPFLLFCFLSREIALVLILVFYPQLNQFDIRPHWSGKLFTALQFSLLFLLHFFSPQTFLYLLLLPLAFIYFLLYSKTIEIKI